MLIYILLWSTSLYFILLSTFLVSYKKYYRYPDERLNETPHLQSYNGRKMSSIESSLFFISVLIIYLFSAIRYGVGWDYFAYYETIKYNLSTNIVLNKEFFTILLVEFARYIDKPQSYFAINSAICIFLITFTIKRYSKDPWISLIFFISFPLFYLNSLSTVRNFTALAITFYGVRYIIDKKMIKYIITVIVASFFHKTALIAMVFYFVKDVKWKISNFLILLLTLPLISLIIKYLITTFVPNYSIYLDSRQTQEGTKAIFVFIFITLVFFMFHKYLVNNKNLIVYFNIFFMGLCIYIMFFKTGTLGHRFSLYGTIYSLLIVPELILLFQNTKARILIKLLFYLFCLIMIIYTIYVGQETYIPYKTFWSK